MNKTWSSRICLTCNHVFPCKVGDKRTHCLGCVANARSQAWRIQESARIKEERQIRRIMEG